MQKLQLSIPEPCHENWQNMTPTDQGRFCNACAKEVVDFSTMTDMQVLNYFTTITNEKVCGRALPEQLDRTISRPAQPKKRLFWYWNYIAMFFMLFAKSNTVKAQGGIKPVTEFSPVNPNNNLRGQIAISDGLDKELSRIINGKVTDTSGNPVPFASIKIKGANTGVSADVNGVFKIKALANAVLVVSGAGYKVTEVSIGIQLVVNTVLEKSIWLGGEVVISTRVGGIRRRDLDEEYPVTIMSKRIAVFEVKEEGTGLLLDKAKISITNHADKKADTSFTDKKGMYKFKAVKNYNNYTIKVEAAGYEPNEFVINGNDFKDRKKVWEVLLRKQKIEFKVPNLITNKLSAINLNGMDVSNDTKYKNYEIKTADIILTNPVKVVNVANGLAGRVGGLIITTVNNAVTEPERRAIRLGGVSSMNANNAPLLVVDDLQVPLSQFSSVNPNEVENVEVLRSLEATALYGSAAADGAIIITTKKLKIKNLDTVSVTAYGGTRKLTSIGGMVSGVYVKSTFIDTLTMVATNITGAIKIYPNPVQRGQQFNLSLKLKQAGLFQVQITDATGRIVLQKRIIALAKEHNEKIVVANNWSAGIYYISIMDKNNNLISRKNFIIQ